MSTDVVSKKLMMFESFGGGGDEEGIGRRCSSSCGIIMSPTTASMIGRRRARMKNNNLPFPSSRTFTNHQESRLTLEDENLRSERMSEWRRNERTLLRQKFVANLKCKSSSSSRKDSGTRYYWFNHGSSKVLLHNFSIFVIVFVTMMNFARVTESVPAAATVENLDAKIKMFLESHCTMQNETLEQEEFKSFMSCGPSHGAGIVKNLGRIPEYKSDDKEQWAKATKREIISQCEIWPQDRTCQETTFRLIEKCFEKDQKFIFYFMFALTDVICQDDQSDLFVKFWQNGGDACLGNHIKTLKKDWTECFEKTSTVSNADVNRNIDGVMQCFRSQFDTDCFGEGADEVLNGIMAEIRKVYLETSSGGARSSASSTSSSSLQLQAFHFPSILIFLTGWTTFLWQKRLHLR